MLANPAGVQVLIDGNTVTLRGAVRTSDEARLIGGHGPAHPRRRRHQERTGLPAAREPRLEPAGTDHTRSPPGSPGGLRRFYNTGVHPIPDPKDTRAWPASTRTSRRSRRPRPPKPFKVTFMDEETGAEDRSAGRPRHVPARPHRAGRQPARHRRRRPGSRSTTPAAACAPARPATSTSQQGREACSKATEDEEDEARQGPGRHTRVAAELPVRARTGPQDLVVLIPKWNRNQVKEGHALSSGQWSGQDTSRRISRANCPCILVRSACPIRGQKLARLSPCGCVWPRQRRMIQIRSPFREHRSPTSHEVQPCDAGWPPRWCSPPPRPWP